MHVVPSAALAITSLIRSFSRMGATLWNALFDTKIFRLATALEGLMTRWPLAIVYLRASLNVGVSSLEWNEEPSPVIRDSPSGILYKSHLT